MKKLLSAILFYALIGGAVMVGVRAIEWLVPKPANQVFVCVVIDGMETECKSLDELRAMAESGRGVAL